MALSGLVGDRVPVRDSELPAMRTQPINSNPQGNSSLIEDLAERMIIYPGTLNSYLMIRFKETGILAGAEVSSLWSEDSQVKSWMESYAGRRIKAEVQPICSGAYLLRSLIFPLPRGIRKVFNFGI